MKECFIVRVSKRGYIHITERHENTVVQTTKWNEGKTFI